jgi:exodeoxyribonuclease V alpha subunit
MATLEAILERITYQSEQNGYTVARVTPRGKNYLVTVVGKLLGVQVGESLELEGRWVDHPEHGRQFEVERYRNILPATVEGIRRYLGSGLIKGVGPVTAKRIAETFGAYTLHVIDNEPQRLREVPGLGPKRVERIIRAWEEQQQIKAIMLFLQELQISPGLAVRIYKQYGEQSLSIVQTTPYRPRLWASHTTRRSGSAPGCATPSARPPTTATATYPGKRWWRRAPSSWRSTSAMWRPRSRRS